MLWACQYNVYIPSYLTFNFFIMHLLKIFFIAFLLFISTAVKAVEGMWLPVLLQKYNIAQMQQMGFKLTANDIYNVNQACLKDAVVGLVYTDAPFRNFCTGELISPQGLILTNHHCALNTIQQHSSLSNNYITDGFWAQTFDDELPAKDIGVTILKRIEDVTNQVLDSIDELTDNIKRDSIINLRISKIEATAVKGNNYLAKVSPYFSGNQYFLTIIELFSDIRLVGAPPSAIGKFGGDTDNWMWPRHTGDFTLLRVYADTNNNPTNFNTNNKPYNPVKYLKISNSGVKKGNFTMVMGYPGTTNQYLPSYAVQLTTNVINPARIFVRQNTLQIMHQAMENNPKVRIQYTAKAASMANSYKKWIGENRGLKRLDAVNKKLENEKIFTEWVNQNPDTQNKYSNILPRYKQLYKQIEYYQNALNYFNETVFSVEPIELASNFYFLTTNNIELSSDKVIAEIEKLSEFINIFYKDYDFDTDKKITTSMVKIFYDSIPENLQPQILKHIDTKFKGNINKFIDWVYSNSIFVDSLKSKQFIANLKKSSIKKLQTDPVMQLLVQSSQIYNNHVRPSIVTMNSELNVINRNYVKALLLCFNNKPHYPDANSTFRIAYGQVDNYNPRDAVTYLHQTYLNGIMEKNNPDIYDYNVPEKLKQLYINNDFGTYADSTGNLPVCFIASNHTTGGNSGSPVLNANGNLIGINFDRNWEGTMSDIMYDPNQCRNIALDIRYVLFIIDKYAGAQHLLNELTIVNDNI